MNELESAKLSDSTFFERIEAVDLTKSSEQFMIYNLLTEEGGGSRITLKAKYFGILLKQGKHLNFEEHPEWPIPFLIAIRNIVYKFKDDSIILEHVNNFVFSEALIDALPNDELLDSYAMIICIISRKPDLLESLHSLSQYYFDKVTAHNVKFAEITQVYKNWITLQS